MGSRLALGLLALVPVVLAQLSKPIVSDAQVDVAGNAFLQRKPTKDALTSGSSDEVPVSTCGLDVAVKWHARVGSAVYATPLIVDLYSDGLKDIIVPAFSHKLEVVDGHGGALASDFEGFHKSTLHTSPLLHDADYDGVQDIVVGTYAGEILFFKDNGEEALPRILLEPLELRRDWYEGLNPDPVDHSDPDVRDSDDVDTGTQSTRPPSPTAGATTGAASHRRRLQGIGSDDDSNAGLTITVEEGAHVSEEAADSYAELFGENTPGVKEESGGEALGSKQGTAAGTHLRSKMTAGNVGRQERMPGDVDGEDLGDDGHDWMAGADDWWDDEYWHAPDMHARALQDRLKVSVDPHVLANPVIADIDGDGRDELVVTVSYFFDKDEYEDEVKRAALGLDVDISKYYAVGVVVYDLSRQTVKWFQHLDLTTETTSFKALAYGTPTVVDVDNDGQQEIVLGTGVGFLYVLSAHTGEALEGWPVQMAPISGAVAAADINGDGVLELVAADTHGNVAAFDGAGRQVWARHLASAVHQGVTLGDIDGDGELEVVVGTALGAIHVMRGVNGDEKPRFPIQAGGRVMAPVLLAPLHPRHAMGRGLHLAVLAHDGFLYIISGRSGCIEALDVGEPGYAQALVDDLDGDGLLELVVATMGGDVYAVSTAAPFHPLKTWTSAAQGMNSYIARWDWAGIWAASDSRSPRDVRGRTLPVRFSIGPSAVGGGAGVKASGPFKVTATIQNLALHSMGAGDRPVIGVTDQVNGTGRYTLEIPCPAERVTATVRLEMVDRYGLVSRDEFSLSFHMHFYKLLKWVVSLPLGFTLAAVLLLRRNLSLPL